MRMLLCLALVAGALPALADVFRPAYLQLVQIDAVAYDVTWKVPALDAQTTLKVAPVFPVVARDRDARRRSFAAGAVVERWRLDVPGGLEGKPIRFAGLARSNLDVLVRVQRLDGSEQLSRILPADAQFTLERSPGPLEVVRSYSILGVGHILAGVDHLLFVLTLMMIVRGFSRLLATITAFTAAHSITLALATLDVVRVPGPPVEASIALSIVFVAAEILRLRQGRHGMASRQPWVVAFAFGLLHGLGFAGALAEVGLPQNSIPLALLFFNVGVEIGQMLFIGAVLAVTAACLRTGFWRGNARWAGALPAYVVGGVASYWVFERTAAFF